MRFEWFVALRYLRQDRSQSALILAAVAVGVATIVFLSALIGGLQQSLLQKTLGSQPHITLRIPDEVPRVLTTLGDGKARLFSVQKPSQRVRSIDQWPVRMAAVESVPGITAVAPIVVGAGFAAHADAKRAIVVRGVDADRYLAIVDLKQKLIAGRFDLSGSEVVIGASLATDLGVALGDKIRLTTTEGVEDVAEVAGIFRLGTEAIDKSWVLTSLRRAQSLYALPGGTTAIEVKVAEVFSADRLAAELEARTGLVADSWMKLNAELLTGLSAQASSKSMIQFFVVVAVALGIASVLIVSVVQKSREIGILRAYGTSSRRVLRVFLIQGGVLGLLGSFLGCGLGALLAKGFEGLVRDPSGAPKFPVVLTATLFLSASLLATAVGVLAAALPARRAARLDPAQAIRNG